jgi:hypothetical protein
MNMLPFSYMVLGLNMMATFVNAVTGNVTQMLLGILVAVVIGYHVWKDSQNA